MTWSILDFRVEFACGIQAVFISVEVNAIACLHKKPFEKVAPHQQLIVLLHIFGNSVINFGFKIITTSNMTTFNCRHRCSLVHKRHSQQQKAYICTFATTFYSIFFRSLFLALFMFVLFFCSWSTYYRHLYEYYFDYFSFYYRLLD